MKWLVAGLIVFSSISPGRADSLSAKERIWNSSYTDSVALTDVAITTLAPSILGGIIVGSPTVSSSMYFYDARVLNQSFSTKTFFYTDTRQEPFEPIRFSSGMIYRKIGTANITILWDYQVRPFTE